MMTDVTRIIKIIQDGNEKSADELIPLIYEELRLLATQKMANESPGHTLQATALIHEAYIRLVDGSDQTWNSKGHFFKASAEAMRRILIENARRKQSLKHGGKHNKVEFDDSIHTEDEISDDIIALDESLTRLTEVKPVVAEVVRLRYFAGFTIAQVSEILGIPRRTVDSYWAFAKAWLYRDITKTH